MPTTTLVYRAAVSLLVPLVPAVLRDPRQRAAHAARLAAPAQLAAWATTHRDPARPLAWFHASSVGEGLQARAVMQAFRAHRPDVQLVYTHYSPSAEVFAATMPADWSGYLPYDRSADMAAALDALIPDLLVFTKLDLWPELATRAAARGAQVALVAGTVSSTSTRLRFPARTLARPGYRALAAAGAISTADGDRIVALGSLPERITVTGDPRIDSALDLAAAVSAENPFRVVVGPAKTLVAGSTWAPDEAVILEAFAIVRVAFPGARLIIVPHDPTPARLGSLEATAARHGIKAVMRLSAIRSGDAPALMVVDRTGMLARLYGAGVIAYVGGGWGTKGIHSVVEPAALARPVIIGPRDKGSRDAELLDMTGGLVRLPTHGAVAALAAQWLDWLQDSVAREVAGRAARAALEPERGAAERSAELLLQLLAASGRSQPRG